MAVKAVRGKIRDSLQKVAATALFALYSSQPALATDLLTQTFDNLSNCTTGREDQCWIDNGFATGNAATFSQGTIKSDGGASGSGYLRIQFPFGRTSTGRVTVPVTPSADATSKYWIRFSTDYHFYTQTHGPGMRITGTGGCDLGGNTEFGNKLESYFFNNGSCGFSNALHLGANQTGALALRGGHWYLVQEEIQIDDSCSDSTSQTGCNGVKRMWIDTVLVQEHTNVNFAGVNRTGRVSSFGYEWYYHIGWPENDGQFQYVDIDQVVVNNTTTPPTADGGVTQGTANSIPYFIGCNTNNYVSAQRNDCLAPDFASRANCSPAEGYASYSSYITAGSTSPSGHNGYPPDATDCPTEAATTDKYLKVVISASPGRAGYGIARDDVGEYKDGAGNLAWYQNWFHAGWIYLPTGNDYSPNVLLVGWRAEKGGEMRALGLSVNSGNWAVGYKWDSSTVSIATTSSTAITENAWVSYELWHDRANQTISLRIGGTKIIDAFDLSGIATFDIMQDPGVDGGASAPIGVLDFQGTAPFSVYYDDTTIRTTSPTSCDGWESGTCPFAAEPDPAGNTGGAFIGKFY